MVVAFTYYKKCICSEGTSTTYAPGCPVHDPRMKTAFGCSDCKRIEAENKRLTDIAGEALGFSAYQRDQDTVEVLANHCKRLGEELAAVKGELAECRKRYAIKATSAEGESSILMGEIERLRAELMSLRARCERLEGERDEYKKRMIYWVNAFLRDFLEWIEEDEVRIEFLKHDMPDTLRKLRKALEVPNG